MYFIFLFLASYYSVEVINSLSQHLPYKWRNIITNNSGSIILLCMLWLTNCLEVTYTYPMHHKNIKFFSILLYFVAVTLINKPIKSYFSLDIYKFFCITAVIIWSILYDIPHMIQIWCITFMISMLVISKIFYEWQIRNQNTDLNKIILLIFISFIESIRLLLPKYMYPNSYFMFDLINNGIDTFFLQIVFILAIACYLPGNGGIGELGSVFFANLYTHQWMADTKNFAIFCIPLLCPIMQLLFQRYDEAYSIIQPKILLCLTTFARLLITILYQLDIMQALLLSAAEIVLIMSYIERRNLLLSIASLVLINAKYYFI